MSAPLIAHVKGRLNVTSFDFGQVTTSQPKRQDFMVTNLSTQTIGALVVALVEDPSNPQLFNFGFPPFYLATPDDRCSGKTLVPGASCTVAIFTENLISRTGTYRATLTASTPDITAIGGSISAVIVRDTLNVNIAGDGHGHGTLHVAGSDRVGFDCDSASGCVFSEANGVTLTFTARPASGSQFAGWRDACASFGATPTCTLTPAANADVLVTATFN